MVKYTNLFSPREEEVLDLLAEQYTYDQMAVKLNIRMSTLRTHIYHIMQKTGIWKQILLVTYAQEHGYGRKKVPA